MHLKQSLVTVAVCIAYASAAYATEVNVNLDKPF